MFFPRLSARGPAFSDSGPVHASSSSRVMRLSRSQMTIKPLSSFPPPAPPLCRRSSHPPLKSSPQARWSLPPHHPLAVPVICGSSAPEKSDPTPSPSCLPRPPGRIFGADSPLVSLHLPHLLHQQPLQEARGRGGGDFHGSHHSLHIFQRQSIMGSVERKDRKLGGETHAGLHPSSIRGGRPLSFAAPQQRLLKSPDSPTRFHLKRSLHHLARSVFRTIQDEQPSMIHTIHWIHSAYTKKYQSNWIEVLHYMHNTFIRL